MSRDGRGEGLPLFADQGAKVLVNPRDKVIAAILHGRSLAIEELRLLVARIQLLNDERPARCIGLLSATGGEGKTTLAIGLATSLAAEPERRVLLVEADLRKPAIESYLGLPRVPGVGEWLNARPGPLPVRWVTPPGFAFLSAGRLGLERPEVLGSNRMAALMDAARQSFDFVVVDCPPVSPVADAVILQDLVDGFLFVVRARHSPGEAVARAASRVKEDRILGTVFNDRKEMLPYPGYGRTRRYAEATQE